MNFIKWFAYFTLNNWLYDIFFKKELIKNFKTSNKKHKN